MSGNPWHKRFHGDALAGYMGLTLEERGAYTTFLDLLYDTDWEEGLADRERWFAGVMNCSVRKWLTIRDSLVSQGKITVLADGKLTNSRYQKIRENELKIARKRAENGSKGGRTKSENAKKSNEIKDGDLAPTSDLLLYARASPEARSYIEEDSTPNQAIGTSHARAREGPALDHMDLSDHLCRIAGVRNVEPMTIIANGQTVQEWISLGCQIDLIESTIVSRRDNTNQRISRLSYFDAAIRRTLARQEHPSHEQPDQPAQRIRDPILRDYVENGGRAGF